ncbi:SnoaL-like polyketide cyclase [Colletotrichum kahawae]|uniref:SnoaL-like polyketide cyclase n=1 Tax=Colletotrichum kahawae TaxID=34407 RepID=A0AAE0DB69_COLKA|nr:SnoaL-like polyketide cyclase [Colletotrichum kahawae]
MASTPGTSVASVFRSLIRHLDEQEWDEVKPKVQPNIDYNGQSLAATVFFASESNSLSPGMKLDRKLDTIIVNNSSDAIAARCINRAGSSESTEGSYEFQEIIFAWFIDNRLARWQSLRDEDGSKPRQHSVHRTPIFTGDSSSRDDQLRLKELYKAYINSINEKTMERDFEHFCQPELEHNGRRLTIAEYIPLISDSHDAIQSLHFHVEELLADEETQQIAARLEFTGTPVREWGGAEPNGKWVKFHENVMYQLYQGKIARVWSVIELNVYRQQMS